MASDMVLTATYFGTPLLDMAGIFAYSNMLVTMKATEKVSNSELNFLLQYRDKGIMYLLAKLLGNLHVK